MHHYGEDSTTVAETPTTFEIIFTNKVTKADIRMTIPRKGSLENANKELTRGQAKSVADEIAHVLRGTLA